MKTLVIDFLKSNLPKNYYYHNHEHTLYVLDKSIEIGNHENCSQEDFKLLTAAALWHDTGYVNNYSNHEEEGCLLAKKYLPGYGYSPDEIEKVCGMIMATKIPQSPKNKLEEIIADADLEYLGTETAEITANYFFRELQSLNPLLTKEEWDKTQISFLQTHHYFTSFCKEKRESIKSMYLNKLINGIS